MFAIIETGGKQYKVAEGDVIRVELLNAEVDSTIDIDKVLAVYDDKALKIGTPYVEGAKVSCKVLEHGKGKKVVVFRYKPKKNERTKNGHRQPYTALEITSLGLKKRAAKKAAKPAEAEAVEAEAETAAETAPESK